MGGVDRECAYRQALTSPAHLTDTSGIGGRLVVGPELRDKCLAARLDEPVRWCLALAAVDWKRIGMSRAIPEPTLWRLTERYLAADAPNEDLTDENYHGTRPRQGSGALAAQSGGRRPPAQGEMIIRGAVWGQNAARGRSPALAAANAS